MFKRTTRVVRKLRDVEQEEMRYRTWQTVILAWLVVGFGGISAQVAQGGLVDWMFNCESREQVTACYPTTPVYSAVTSGCCEPTVSYQSPDTMCCPPTATYATQPAIGRRLGSCFSSAAATTPTSYRTTWRTVPVTSYRPIMSTDPVTGCPVTVMKPCTTYAWQADRRPCGFFDRLCGRCDAAPTQSACYEPAACCEQTAGVMSGISSGSGCGCSGSAVSTVVPTPSAGVPTPAPYYAPGPSSILTPSPAGSQSPTLAPPPASPVPGVSPPSTPSPVPADTRPTLKPVQVPPASPTDVNSPAASQPPMTGLPWNHATPANKATATGHEAETGPSLGPPLLSPTESRPNPVPSPEAAPAAPAEKDSVPQLLNPRDQVASLRTGQSWGYSTITWPTSRRVPTDRVAPLEQQRELREWDESGWQSVGKGVQ
ncbi:MAG: hypothetical protein ACYC3X_09445 [Pirellulaceae bacterium]